MAAPCDRRNPLTRSGTGQGERFPAPLDPTSFSVDERTTADRVLWARRYAAHIQHHPMDGTPAQDWVPFFSHDPTAVFASLARLPVPSFSRFTDALQEWLVDDPGRDPAQLSAHLKLLFHLPAVLLLEAGRHMERLPSNHPLESFMTTVVDGDLAVPLRSVVAYYEGALELGRPPLADPPVNGVQLFPDTPLDLTDYNTTLDSADPRIQLPSSVTELLTAHRLADLPVASGLMTPLGADWSSVYAAVSPDAAPWVDAVGDVYQQIFDGLNYNLLSKAFGRVLQGLERISAEAQRHLHESLTTFDAHTPHYGLWLSFLRLMEVEQAELNTFTRRHLEHYYRGVLQLCPRSQVPDHVHLVLELGKNVDEHLVESGSRLKAGKDALGRAVSYEIDTDFVVNRGTVVSRMGVLQPSVPYASPMVDSGDGRGSDLENDDPRWKPFGPMVAAGGASAARVGFAVADRRLFLREGRRTITIEVDLASNLAELPPGPFLPDSFTAWLSGADGWHRVTPTVEVDVDDRALTFTVLVDGDAPPIIPHDPAVHVDDEDRAFPPSPITGKPATLPATDPVLIMEFDLTSDPGSAAENYELMRDLRASTLRLRVEVSGVRNLTLQSDAGLIDPSKAFLPFGAQPKRGSALTIGSSEVFSKPLTALSLDFEWQDAWSYGGSFKIPTSSDLSTGVYRLSGGVWEGATSLGRALYAYNFRLDETGFLDTLIMALPLGTSFVRPRSSISLPALTGSFDAPIRVRLENRTDFGHAAYPAEYARALIAQTAGDDPPTDYPPADDPRLNTYRYDDGLPKLPFTPVATSISLNYTTSDDRPAQAFHIAPFGFSEASGLTQLGTERLFPEMPFAGELYIGVAELDPPQRLELLFRTVEGSSNPLKLPADLEWSYLQGNAWQRLEDRFVDDGTGDLTGTGVVGLAIPREADTDHSVLPTGLHWIRVAAATDTDALNDLREIRAQATRASFVDMGNDPAFLMEPLAAGTISKLQPATPAIKRIEQPDASFGGRAVEPSGHFYLRAAERLRHKDRGSSMWDYERLVLEAFPKLYKAKCINHTALCRDLSADILADNEVAPGHVLLVTVPYVDPTVASNPLRPYTDRRTLGLVDTFLRERISPFVQLEVQNPKFEEIQVSFDVRFGDEIADLAFYKSELNLAIQRHLTPWAYEGGVEISFGGRWHKAAIIDFVEEQPYVHYVKEFQMYHRVDIDDEAWSPMDEEIAEASTARSILVSHPDHLIDPIPSVPA